MTSRLLSALAFPAVILAIVLLWQARTTTTPLQTTLCYTGAAVCILTAAAGFRERHRKG